MCRIWRCMAEVVREIGWDFRGAVWNYCYCVCSHHRHIFAWYHSASMAPFLSRAYFEAFGNGGEGTLVEDMCNAAFLQVLLSLPRGCRAVISAKNVSVDTHPLGIRLCSRWHVAFACIVFRNTCLPLYVCRAACCRTVAQSRARSVSHARAQLLSPLRSS